MVVLVSGMGSMDLSTCLSQQESMPFAVVGSDKEYQVNGKRVLGRKTPWGIIEGKKPLAYGSWKYCLQITVIDKGPDSMSCGYFPIPFVTNCLKPAKKRILKYLCQEGTAMVNMVPLSPSGRSWSHSEHHGV